MAPGLGTAIGGALGSAASNMFELELEGLSQEDREFETAKAYVRLPEMLQGKPFCQSNARPW
ncbi:MAG: hypothetical protein IPG02_10755 [Ignavibacteria bacterium]|nr:hypothetical protein [Ignavibacteria bacterium]